MTEEQITQLLNLIEHGTTAAAVLFGAHIIIGPVAGLLGIWLVTKGITSLVTRLSWSNQLARRILGHINPDAYRQLGMDDQRNRAAVEDWVDEQIQRKD